VCGREFTVCEFHCVNRNQVQSMASGMGGPSTILEKVQRAQNIHTFLESVSLSTGIFKSPNIMILSYCSSQVQKIIVHINQ
jgi:hypothetical protein